MDVFVYGYREEEARYFEECAHQYQVGYGTCSQRPTMENAALCAGYRCVSVLSTPIPAALVMAYYEQGVRFISTRTIGYDHIDMEACRRVGMRVGNANYAPESVADYTIMLLLMSLRKMKLIMKSADVQDYSFSKVQGTNVKGKCIGVIGTGSIGQTFLRHMAGFECELLAYAPHPKEEMKDLVNYVDLDTLLARCDIITLHVPLNHQTHHMINAKTIAKMKDGVVLLNTARGPLIDNVALIEGIESGKIGAVALDVVEGETGIFYNDRKGDILTQHDMAILQAFPNVIVSPHMAFLTSESNRDMVVHSMQSCTAFLRDEDNAWEIL